MLDFFEQYGLTIFSAITGICGAIASVCAVLKTFNIGKKVNTSISDTHNEIKVTREGIVEAFKTAKIPSEWKISVANNINSKLDDFETKVLRKIDEGEKFRNDAVAQSLRILSYTAAYNKLSEDEKNHINDIVKECSETDNTIEIGTDTEIKK